jgi:choline dehydrogenase-like flavoprotein
LTGVVVEKILFNTSDPSAVATGVQIIGRDKSSIKKIKARKEVILAAGTLNSPKLLELSGIGGKDLLASKGVDLIVDNPNVGENFHDHPMTGMSYEVADTTSTLDNLTRQEPQAVGAAMEAYQSSRTGPFSAGAVNSFAFMPMDDFLSVDGKSVLERLLQDHEAEAPSIQYDMLRSVYSSADQSSGLYFVYSAQGNFGAESTTGMTKAADPANFITIVCETSYPLSRGSSHISSSSSADPPNFDPGYLRNSLDVEILARQALFMEKIVSIEPLASLLKPGGKRLPSYGQFSDLESAKEYLKRTTTSSWHPVGTCAMLPREKGGVVDDRLVVYGTTNLRVVDASIMPLISRGNTQSTVYAVAEKAADLIKENQRLNRDVKG